MGQNNTTTRINKPSFKDSHEAILAKVEESEKVVVKISRRTEVKKSRGVIVKSPSRIMVEESKRVMIRQ